MRAAIPKDITTLTTTTPITYTVTAALVNDIVWNYFGFMSLSMAFYGVLDRRFRQRSALSEGVIISHCGGASKNGLSYVDDFRQALHVATNFVGIIILEPWLP